MSGGTVFLVDGNGLTRMRPGAPSSEDKMQELVARYPELIGDADGDLLLISREQPVSDGLDSSGRWSLDHLFVTRNAVPVLVELKRASDTRLRREIVGQLLDYAANGVAYWQAGSIAEAFRATCASRQANAEEVLSIFLGDADISAFWEQVDANLKAGRIKLVFVADVIPPELARVVEFLNEQMRADVRAVELRWFEGDSGVMTLVPRIIGETQRAAAHKSAGRDLPAPIGIEDWITKMILPRGQEAMDGARAFLRLIRELNGEPVIPSTQGSIGGAFRTPSGRKIYPLHLWGDTGLVSATFAYLKQRPRLVADGDRQRHYDAFVSAVGPLSNKNLSGFPGFKVQLLRDPTIFERVLPVARELVEDAMSEP